MYQAMVRVRKTQLREGMVISIGVGLLRANQALQYVVPQRNEAGT